MESAMKVVDPSMEGNDMKCNYYHFKIFKESY